MGNPSARPGLAATSLMVAALAVAALAVSAPAGAADAPDVFGTFWVTRYDAKIQVVGGGELPLTPAGKAAYEMNIAGLKDGSITDASRRWCVPGGLPRALANPYPFEIINAPHGQVTFVYELSHMVRAVQMDQPLPSDKELIPYPYFNGHSVGRFEGDALVIETAGFNERTFIDSTGAPHTDLLHTIERIRRISPMEIEDVVTIHDPEYYSRDWQTRFVYQQHDDLRMQDYVCGEQNRDISSVPGVRRP
jgi:hypothetical protein